MTAASSLSKFNEPWELFDEYSTINNGKISIYKREDDPTAEIITLVTSNGRRIVVHRTKKEAILMSSDRQGNATRYIQCKRE
jgi:hypothetical protein|uniref:Translational initiation factor 1 n=2 Tax=Panagrolaimus TaxID=55784 RepID=A0A914QEU0_9BILA